MNYRFRYAPSPTGVLHVGNARTAIFNWLLARHYSSKLILRIEDTDKERSTPESEKAIIEDLKWLGLDWDEGPDVGGDCGPYRQSQRSSLYEEHQKLLLEKKAAYECFCTPDELKKTREELLSLGKMPKYNGKCLNLSPKHIQELKDQKKPFVIRFYVKPGPPVVVDDIVRGTVKFEREVIGDFVIFRSDGGPTYQLACVVDDSLMKITHVIRGDDHLSNTPKQILMNDAFGFTSPKFGHLPMVLGADRKKLSKRHGACSVGEYKQQGYVSSAFLNFLVLLGWSCETSEEILNTERLIKEFSEDRLSSSPSIFETNKLDWMNGQYIRQLSLEEFYRLERPFLEKDLALSQVDESWLKQVLKVLQTSVAKLTDVTDQLQIFLKDKFLIEDDVIKETAKDLDFKKVLIALSKILEDNPDIDFDDLKKQLQNETSLKGKKLFHPLRYAMTGRKNGPELALVMPLLPKNELKLRVDKLLKETS
ncbi:MAG: glutamate--tRNA ligase [Deltaproteobacteria bacterium]|nr:glutamate--tRNA ligase [Deltaproteobacteria bacterium]